MRHRFLSLPLGIQLATGALVVAVPRYIVAFLAADNLRFPFLVEGTLLGISAIATAIIVAGGGAYVAHIVSSAHGHLLKRVLLLMLWLVLLACEIVLLAPPVVASLRRSELAQVLAPPLFDALWSVVMVATPALCAAACVLAASLVPHSKPHMQPQAGAPQQTPAVAEPPPSEPSATAPATVEVTPVVLMCEHCDRSFETINALNAHRWRCKAKRATATVATPSLNGHR